MKKLSRVCAPDLLLEMGLDLITIYCSLLAGQCLGYIIFPSQGWMAAWQWAVSLVEEDAHKMYVLGNLVVLLLVYWIPATLYTLLDVFKPHVFYQYKVQPEKSQSRLTVASLRSVAVTVLSNQITQTLIGSEIAWRWRYQYINMDIPLADVPSLHRMMAEIILFLIIFETVFYHSHVLLHSKSLFKYHKKHHDWRAPIALATAYGHPLDFLLHCVVAVSLGPVLVRSHLATAWLWYLVITLHELNDHSGYHFPWLRSSQAHDYHHRGCTLITSPNLTISGPCSDF